VGDAVSAAGDTALPAVVRPARAATTAKTDTRSVTNPPGAITAHVIRAAQRGDALAMNELLDALGPYVRRICGSIALRDGADAAQDTLIIVFTKLHTLKDSAALFGWVRAIAVREALRYARNRQPTVGLSQEQLAEIPERASNIDGADILDVLSRLSPEHRAVLVLRAVDDLDDVTIAQILSVPSGTVKSRLHRARTRFRKEWQS
jgi:RNA polymerase sigma-70 factor (ECF subfamily)